MRSCERYQAQLLEHFYGLLDADESLALVEHASQCEECRAALQQADGHRKLLSAAAKASFPALRFQPPAVLEPAATLSMPRKRPTRTRLPRHWRRYGVAAAVLLGVVALGAPVVSHYFDSQAQGKRVDVAERRVNDAREEERNLVNEREEARRKAFAARKTAEAKAEALGVDQKKALDEAGDEILRQQMYLVVTGHDSVRPGMPNEYQIETKNLKDEKVKAQLDIRVRDLANNQVVQEHKDVKSEGNYILTLPADLPLKASNQLALEVSARSESGAQKGALTEKLTLARSVYVTQLVTDKPMYQPGETVHYRSLTLDRYTLKPAQEEFRLVYTLLNGQGQKVAMFDSQGDPIVAHDPKSGQAVPAAVRAPRLIGVAGREAVGPDKQPLRGIGVGDFTIPDELDGGEYTLVVEEANKKFPPERRKFLVNVYQKPRLNKELNLKPAYGPGDEVTVLGEVKRAEGGDAVVGQPVAVTIRVDGKSYRHDGKLAPEGEDSGLALKTDARGKVTATFRLPTQVEKGEASVAFQFTDGASYEAIVRPFEITVKKLQLEFFPEGGELVAGVPNRVYFQARTPLDKPAQVKGTIVDANGKFVADVQTLSDEKEQGINQGMGVCEFKPVAGMQYELKIQSPANIEGKFLLPIVAADGVALRLAKGVTTDTEPMTMVVHSARRDRELLIGAYCRGGLLDFQSVRAVKDQPTTVSLKPSRGIGGVYRVTVFEKQGPKGSVLKPVAERLVYRMPGNKLNLSVRADKKQYAPGEKVTLDLTASTAEGKPSPTVLLVGVVDKSVLKMADERTARSLPTHFLLTTEVRRAEDLEFADILLSDHPRAPAALDLLLGTQGWRRFIESDPERFDKDQNRRLEDARVKADVDRLKVVMGKMTGDKDEEQKRFTTFQLKQEQVLAKFRPAFEQVAVERNDADVTLAALDDPATLEARRQQLQQQVESSRSAYLAELARHRSLSERSDALRSRAILVFGIALLLAGGVCMVVGMKRSLARALPVYAGAVGAVSLCGLVLVATILFQGRTSREDGVAVATVRSAEELNGPVREKRNAGGGGAWDQPDAKAAPMPAEDREVDRFAPKPRDGKGQGGKLGDKDAAGYRVDPNRKVVPPVNGMDPRQEGPVDGQQGRAGDNKPTVRAVVPGKNARQMEEQKHAQKRDALNGGNRPQLAGAIAPNGPGAAPAAPAMAQRPGEGAAFGNQDLRNNARRDLQMEALEKADAFKKAKDEMERARNPNALKELENLKLREQLAQQQKQLAEACIVREFAHRRSGSTNGEFRLDFTETLYWHPALVLDGGKAQVSFELCDSSTTFQVLLAGHTLDGRLAAVSTEIESRKPFSIDATLPHQVVASDIIDVPVSVMNDSNESRRVNLSLSMKNLTLTSPSDQQRQLVIAPKQRTRTVFQVKPTVRAGEAVLTIRGSSEPFGSDGIQRTFKIVPEGFPATDVHSDVLEGGAALHEVVLPKNWVKGTLKCEVNVYPSTLADLQKGLESLLREPNGCFEQTSTSNYPNLLILQYLRDTRQDLPEVEDRARRLLASGYGKLVSFECQKPGGNGRQGYEWFGGAAPAHEALTAYGLMQFRDMAAQGLNVDKAMIDRTHQYLLSRRDKKGGFERNARALDTFGRAPDHITNAYIVWALTEGDPEGKDDLKLEIDALTRQAKDSNDPYFVALVANSLLNRSQHAQAAELLQKLVKAQKPDGALHATQTSITGSGGRDLQIETTALTVLAWLKAKQPVYQPSLRTAAKWIGQQRGGYGGFGSTQATILALKALIAHAKADTKPVQPGTLTLVVNGQRVAALNVEAGTSETLTLALNGAEELLKAGKNDVRVELTGNNVLPFTLTTSYQALTPVSPGGCPVRLDLAMDRKNVQDGETARLKVKVENTTAVGYGMAVAVIGLPAGLDLPENFEQLKNYAKLRNDGTEPGVISHFEVRGRELVLYWRQLAPKQKIELNLDLICRVPGDYRGPASRAYLYYNADNKHWVDPVQVAIAPK